jgi:serine/threonine-protein kinase RsbW
MNTLHRTITNELHELQGLMLAGTNFLEDRGVGETTVYRVNLALEELITNIIKHGYKDYDQHEIHVTLEVGEQEIKTVIEDDGKPFDPLAWTKTETKDSLETRPVGGLGISLIKDLLDNLSYRREGNKNILEIKARR